MAMLASNGDDFREYMLKMEPIAVLLHEITNGLIKYNSFLKDEKISSLEAQTAGHNQQSALIKQIGESMAFKNPTGWFYIATSQIDLAVNHFKLGITENLHSRLKQYSTTFSTPATEVFYCDYWSLHEPKMVEKISKIVLKSYHLKNESRKKQDETYILNYDIIHNIISQLCTGYASVIDLVNHQLANYKEDICKPSKVVAKPLPKTLLCIEMKITTGDQSITIPLDLEEMTEAQRADVCKSLINSYVRAKTQHKAYDIATDEKESIEPKIDIVLDELEKFIKDNVPHGKKGKVEMPVLRRIITSTLIGIKNINFLKTKPKAKLVVTPPT
jgi:hypothetical protein